MMITYLFLVCLVQGIGECLPISSSAHLFLSAQFFTRIFGSVPIAMNQELEVSLHLGSLLALCVFFWTHLKDMLFGLWCALRDRQLNSGVSLAIVLVCATIPSIIAGFVVKRYLSFEQTLTAIGYVSIIFGLLLYISDRLGREDVQKITFTQALIVGGVQILAFIPGASRMGSCLMAARFLNIERIQSTRFAFLMAIPAISGAVILTAFDMINNNIAIDISFLVVPVLLTAVFSYGMLHILFKYLQRYTYKSIGLYRVFLGIILIIYASSIPA